MTKADMTQWPITLSEFRAKRRNLVRREVIYLCIMAPILIAGISAPMIIEENRKIILGAALGAFIAVFIWKFRKGFRNRDFQCPTCLQPLTSKTRLDGIEKTGNCPCCGERLISDFKVTTQPTSPK
ncbi:MAG: hypothetical protein AAF226_08795 [Verrucomicrobiota bacterium]